MKKPKLLLLDTDVVLVSYLLEVWDQLKAKYDIHVTSIVAEKEAIYAKNSAGKFACKLARQAVDGEITIVEASAIEMGQVIENFVEEFRIGIDDGELEGLAVIRRQDLADCKFCLGDTNGIQAAGMLDIGDCTISLEEALELAGIKIPVPIKLPPQFSKRHHAHHVSVGSGRRITNEYFKRPPLSL